MLSRRAFLAYGCCAAHQVLKGGATAYASETAVFTCSTIDELPGGPVGFSIKNYAAQSTDRIKIDNSIKQFRITPYGTSFFKDRWLVSDGNTPGGKLITLGVNFFNGTSQQKQTVQDAANAWLQGELAKRIVFDFSVPREQSQIRIAFGNQGNWSYIGRNCLRIGLNNFTMTLQDVVPYIVMHEFGHALGLQHEQQFPDQTIVWDRERVIRDMQNEQGWSPKVTEANVLNKYTSNAAACIGDPKFNRESIMLYPIRPEWTKNGFSVGVNTRISPRDLACLSGLYLT